MYVGRPKIRQIVEDLEWVTPRNITYLGNGKFIEKDYFIYREELERLTKTVRIPPLKKLRNRHNDVGYARPETTLKYLSDFKFIHDRNLRDCICRFIRETGKQVCTKHKYADAYTEKLFFEFDNGHMTDKQLSDKIKQYYAGSGKYQVVFWMGHKEDKQHLEDERLKKLMDIGSSILKGKPRRILANTYQDYLDTGKLFDLKGREV